MTGLDVARETIADVKKELDDEVFQERVACHCKGSTSCEMRVYGGKHAER